MRHFLILITLFFWGTYLHSEIYDCFLFFNEEEILKIHLEELYEKVDYFVLVEGKETFSGKDKGFLFPSIKENYEKYLDKIIYVPVEESYPGDNPWPRETFQRNQILRGLKGCRLDDIIIIGDVDEIVKAEYLDALIQTKKEKNLNVIGCGCDFYRWFLNRKDDQPWTGSAVTTYAYLKQTSPEYVRGIRVSYIMERSGWHFSNMGGLEVFLEKLRSFSHYKEVYPEKIKEDPQSFYQYLQHFRLVPIDASFPKYIQENISYYERINFLDKEGGAYY